MWDYCLMTDSCCDLTAQMERELELIVLPLSLHIGGETLWNWLDEREITFRDFYQRIRDGAFPTTSAVSVGNFETAMRREREQNRDVLCICFASALSTTCQSASIAAEHLRPEFPQRRIEVIDSLTASVGQGLLMYLCAKERQAGKTLEEVRDFALATRDRICGWFTVEDLNHLKRGGRISAATALFGTMLSIKPILHVDETGALASVDKVRGRRASITALVDHMAATADDPARQTVFISHGDCPEDAEILAEEVRTRLHTEDIQISYVGPVIGSHTGAGVLTLFFLGHPK